jgi:hypothetical protein
MKKIGIAHQAMPEVQESQGFKALRNNLTANLEKFRAVVMQEHILKANNMNVKGKRS